MSSKKASVDSITSDTTLVDDKNRLHAQFEGSDTELTVEILCLHFVIFTAIEAHNAKGVGLGVHVPYTDADIVNWCSPEHVDTDLIERLEDVSALLAQPRARMTSSTAKDKETLEHNEKMTIQTANAALVNTIIPASIGQEGFKTLENLPAYQVHQEVFSVIPKPHTNHYHRLSSDFSSIRRHVRAETDGLYCETYIAQHSSDMFARKLTDSTVKHTTLNTPPEVEQETIDEFKKTIKDAADILINKKLLTADVLVDHLMVLALVQYINLAAENKNRRAVD